MTGFAGQLYGGRTRHSEATLAADMVNSTKKTKSSPRSINPTLIVFAILILAFSVFVAIPGRFQISLIALSKRLYRGYHHSPTMRLPLYERELQVAELAVQRATLLTKRVFHDTNKGETSKDDTSPVTIGDFGAQALIISAIRKNFPDDEIVGEEDSEELRKDEKLRSHIWDLVKTTALNDTDSEAVLGGSIESEQAMLEAIDAGGSAGGAKGRIWALDPIDGTKGFLRGGQYAVCLALIEDGDVKVGVLGCPNLPIDDSAKLEENIGKDASDGEGKGMLFSAVRAHGAQSRPLSAGAIQPLKYISMKPLEKISEATFCESVEAGHSSHDDTDQIAKKLNITKPSVRLDSQAKYASIARGAGDLYLRLPTRKDYQEKIWDHAAGDLIVRESGGQVTDIEGKRLDFSLGRTLKNNKGVVAAPQSIHDQVLEAVKEVLGKK